MTSYDYNKLYVIAQAACDAVGVSMMELNSSGPELKPPFVAFDIISPHINLNYLEDDTAGQFELVCSLTVYDLDKLHAIQTADNLRQYMATQAMTDLLLKQQAVLVERMPTNIRSVPNVNKTAHMVGFDYRLRVTEPLTEPDKIDTVEIKEEMPNGK